MEEDVKAHQKTSESDVLTSSDKRSHDELISHAGRMTLEGLRDFLPAAHPQVLALVCGPPAFNAMASKHLTVLGYREDNFFVFQ